MNDVVVFSSPEAALSAAAREIVASVARLVKLAEGLRGAVQRARLDGLGDQEIARHLSVLGVPIAVRAALAADSDGTAMRFLVASLIVEADGMFNDDHEDPERVTHAIGWG